jgi:hypothetical protein
MRFWLNWYHVDECAVAIEAASERVAPLDALVYRPFDGGAAIGFLHGRSCADMIRLRHIPRS